MNQILSYLKFEMFYFVLSEFIVEFYLLSQIFLEFCPCFFQLIKLCLIWFIGKTNLDYYFLVSIFILNLSRYLCFVSVYLLFIQATDLLWQLKNNFMIYQISSFRILFTDYYFAHTFIHPFDHTFINPFDQIQCYLMINFI